MNRNPFAEIKTERLFLRKLRNTDWKIISYLRSDKEVNLFVKRPRAESKDKAIDFITKTNNGMDDRELYYWCITQNHTDLMIGSICLWNFSKSRKTAEVGYDLSPRFQGQGIMNEAMRSVLEFGYNDLQIDLIKAYTHHGNKSSKKLLEKNSFKLIVGRKDEHNEDNLIYELGNHVCKNCK
jgi:ribosomal-protein-alanine N-acetyltransferase